MNIIEIISSIFILLGSIFVFNAVLGVVRFKDSFAIMHSSTKPQTLGLLFILIGLIIYLHTWKSLGLLLLCFVFTLMTVPPASYTIARAYNTKTFEDKKKQTKN